MGNRDYINDLNYVNEWNYGLASDAWNRDKYDDETYYNRQMDRVALMSELGDYSGLKTLAIRRGNRRPDRRLAAGE